jgi:hypothetical protein
MTKRDYSTLEPVKAFDQLHGEETRRLIDAGTVVDEAYQSKKAKERVIVSHSLFT